MSTPGTKANLKIGDVLGGTEPGLRAQACLLYKEWDEEDGELYYWEEWELVGPNRYEYWVEVDHDSGQTSLYELLPATDVIDPVGLQVGQYVTLTGTMAGQQAVVTERGLGYIEKVMGRTTYPASPGESMIYVTVRTKGQGGTEITFENCPGRPLRAYRKRAVSSAEQRRRFGRVIHASGSARAWYLLLWVVVIAVVISVVATCATRGNRCDPTKEDCSSSSYRHRGPYGGGGGGVGK